MHDPTGLTKRHENESNLRQLAIAICRGDEVVAIVVAAVIQIQAYPTKSSTTQAPYSTRHCAYTRTGVVAALQPVKQLGKAGRSLIFVLWFLVRLLLFHCMPTGRHSDSTPDGRRFRLCSRLPCGSYGAGSPTAVVCSRELVGCDNGGTPCCS